ncbi:MAG TPA: DNA recombination protein RmuC [Usitatibacter sp.]|jgi:DNA recombination protein RmuC|nr:DNA recombination protein RmuC [Usitatibacter sp.]
MESTAVTLLIAVLGAAGGFAVAWYRSRARPSHDGSRVAELEAQLVAAREQALRSGVQAAELERDASTLRTQLLEAVQNAATFEERAKHVDELRDVVRQRESAIAALQSEGSQLRTRAAELHTRLEEARQQSAEKLQLLSEAQRALENSFKSLSADALKSNNQSFIELARASLGEFAQAAKGDLEKRQQAIDALVLPVKTSLEKVDEKIALLERAREQAYGEIRAQFTQMAEVQTLLRQETSNLVKALRQPHVRGRWGEVQLRRVVEMAGMLEHVDFVEQETASTDEGRLLRPDLVVRLPGGRQIVVDSKAPLSAYLDAHEAQDEEVRKSKIREHAAAVRGHLQALARKTYWEQFQPTPEVVVMFIPGEAFCSAALESDPELLDTGFGQNVIIASPASLMAILKAAAYGWRQETIQQNYREISELGRELHQRLGTMVEHFERVGVNLGRATESYNSAIASFESRVLVSARKFKEQGATSKEAEIIELRAVESAPRKLQAVDKPLLGTVESDEPKSS